MRIIAITPPPVKPYYITPRRPGRFGQGILATRPSYKAPYSAADAAWAAEHLGNPAYHAHLDRLAALAAAVDRQERGLDAGSAP